MNTCKEVKSFIIKTIIHKTKILNFKNSQKLAVLLTNQLFQNKTIHINKYHNLSSYQIINKTLLIDRLKHSIITTALKVFQQLH